MIWRFLVLVLAATLASIDADAAEQPKRGGAAIVAVQGDPGHLNPAISTAGPLHAIAGSIHNGLVALDQDGTPRPDLAENWSIAPDGRSATFRLRAGVTWHDGRPFGSADVKFSFEKALFRFHARARAGLAPVVAAIETPDDLTVVFRLHRPHPALLRQLDVTEAPIIPRHVHEGTDMALSAASARPIGTGPFRFEVYRRDDQVVLSRNPTYFKSGLPYLDRLVFRIIPDATTQINAFLAGEVDMIARVSAVDLARLAGRPIVTMNTRAAPGGANCVTSIAFNLDRTALADTRVRRALAMAIDRERILGLVIFGQGRIARAPIASGLAWASLEDAFADIRYNPAGANQLLDEAGLARGGDGIRTTFDIVHFPAFARYSELLRQQLAQVGVGLRVRPADPAALAHAVFTLRDFDMALINYCNGVDPEIGVRRMVHSSAVGPVPFSNAAGLRDDEVDRLFDIAAATIDQAARGGAYRAAQRRLAALLPYWWLVETDFTSAWREDFVDFAPWSGQFAETAWRRR